MLPDVIQTGKYGTAAKENVLQILLHIQMILSRQMLKFQSRI